jgi:cytochrome c peroxidase
MTAFAGGRQLEVEITPRVSGEDLQPASLRYHTSAGETFSITRVSYLISDFALQCGDGSWLEISNSVAWLDFAQNRRSLRLAGVPSGEYRSVRFLVGLDPALNHADIAGFPAGHPLNPNLNGLHWSWQGGYIFLALEGLWRNAAGRLDGWACHFARDTNATRVTLAAPLSLTNNTKIELDFDLASLLNAPRPLSFGRDGSSTHSRDGDPVAATLAINLPSAFRLRKISALTESSAFVAATKPLYLPAKFTPYPFQMSATFPMPDLPRDNPLTQERVALGQKLFNEAALSRDSTLSCASCHQTSAAFADPRRFSVGVRGQAGTRNAMPLLNLAWKHSYFWDGRAPSLRAQALLPIQDAAEMDETLTNVAVKLAALTTYPPLFSGAFGSAEITPEKIGLALENYLLTLTSFDAKFDRVLRGEEKFTAAEQRGFELFATEYDPRRQQYGADCFHCHGGPLFSDFQFHNNGLNLDDADLGRYRVTKQDADQGKFATPSLRNIELTAPYMHDGKFQTLDDVVAHYDHGVHRTATLDPNLAKHPPEGLRLSRQDQDALVAFLKTLTDARFRTRAYESQ